MNMINATSKLFIQPKVSSQRQNTEFVLKSNSSQDAFVMQLVSFGARISINEMDAYNVKPLVQIKAAASAIMKKFKVFGLKEYKSLNSHEKSILKKAFSPLSKKELNALQNENIYLHDECLNIDKRNANSYKDDILKLAKIAKANLEATFPNGFTLVSIGRSPALVASALDYQGYSVKYFPASCLDGWNGSYGTSVAEKDRGTVISEFNTQLKNIHLTKGEIENSENTIIFTDCKHSGNSLKTFQEILGHKDIGILEGAKVKFLSLNDHIINGKEPIKYASSYGRQKAKNLVYFTVVVEGDVGLKEYVHIPHLPLWNFHKGDMDIFNKPDYVQRPWAKQMQFLLLDSLEAKGLLKKQ